MDLAFKALQEDFTGTWLAALRMADGWSPEATASQSSYLGMVTTKQRFKKTGGRQFYHLVQSFSANDDLTPEEVNAIGVELTQREFPDFEVLVATHCNTGHYHNHFVSAPIRGKLQRDRSSGKRGAAYCDRCGGDPPVGDIGAASLDA